MSDSEPPAFPPTESIRPEPSPDQGLARLVVVSGPDKGQKLLMTSSRATIGRHRTNDLVLDDRGVSAAHLEVQRRPGGRLALRDLRSTNGTWLGTTRVEEAEVAPGALIRIGDTSLRVELDDRARSDSADSAASFGSLIGESAEMRELFTKVSRLAPTELSLVLEGESGTGKDALARAIHAASSRSEGPFVIVDASALAPHSAEALLFGKEEPGALEQARGGTLFIDEVGELPANIHAPLLRALESRAFFRVSDPTPRTTDFRLVCSSTHDLRADIETGKLKEGLYFRIAEARLYLPPLRARTADIRPLASQFIQFLESERPLTLGANALALLESRAWPGNVRELRNVVVRAAALAASDVIDADDVAGEGAGSDRAAREVEAISLSGTFADAKNRAIEHFERAYLDALLRRCAGNISEASRRADVARNHLRSLLKKRGLYDPGDG
jgi:two-component system nitrogen regulation response regulator GlnG